MVELSIEQHEAIVSGGKEPVRAYDPATNHEYVILRAELFDRVKSLLLDDDWAQDAYTAAMPALAREGWDDPRMSVYDAMDPRKTP
jgi:hypothetical protein